MIKSLNLAFQDEKLGLVRLKFGLLKYWGLNSWITGFDWSLNCQACVLTWSDASCHMSSARFILIRSAKKASWIKLDLDSRFNSRFKHVHLQPGKQVVSIATTQWFRYQRRDYAASRLRTVVFWGCEDQDKDSFLLRIFFWEGSQAIVRILSRLTKKTTSIAGSNWNPNTNYHQPNLVSLPRGSPKSHT